MTSDANNYMDQVAEYWGNGRPLEAGRLIFENLPNDIRENRGRGTMSTTREATVRGTQGLPRARRLAWPDSGCNKNLELRWQFGHNCPKTTIRARPVTTGLDRRDIWE